MPQAVSEWTKEAPTVPGDYAYRVSEFTPVPVLVVAVVGRAVLACDKSMGPFSTLCVFIGSGGEWRRVP